MSSILRSTNRYMTTPVQRDPDRWLYKQLIAYVKCTIENRRNAYANYFAALKCQPNDYVPEGSCSLNKFEKFNIEQTFKLYQQINKVLSHAAVEKYTGGYASSLIEAHRKAKIERAEYTKYIQSLDNGRELKPFHENETIQRLEAMNKEQHADFLRKREEELNRKRMDNEAKKAARKLKLQQMQKQMRDKIDADKRTLEAFEASAGGETPNAPATGGRPPSRKPIKPKK